MFVKTCPAFWIPKLYMPIRVFLAGGISNCPNWQADAITMAKVLPDDVLLYNPKRVDFDITDPSATIKQIQWEHHALTYATGVLFWFPEETLCPITLFELGKLAGKKPLFVGTHPNYARRLDVIEQLKYIDSTIVVRDNLQDVVNDVVEWSKTVDTAEQHMIDINNVLKGTTL
jgi:hypothetical protein